MYPTSSTTLTNLRKVKQPRRTLFLLYVFTLYGLTVVAFVHPLACITCRVLKSKSYMLAGI